MILNKQEQAEIDYYLERYDCFKALNNKTVLITGYKGLVGTGITKWLLRYKEKTSIHLNLYLSSRNPDVLPDWLESKDDVKFTKFLTEADLENDYDIIIHLAAPTDKKYFVVNPIDSIDSIYEGTKYYLNLARKQASCQFLYVSSVEVYGCPCGDLTLDESYVGKFSSFDVRSGYPLGKKAAEFLCFSYWIQYGVRTYVIRPSSIQGLFQRYDETRIFNEILRCMIEGKDFVMKSDGRTKKNLIYSLDAISAIFSVLQNGKPGQAYNVTNPSIYLSMNDYVETVFKSFNANLKIVHKTEKDQKEGFLPHLEYNLCTKKIERLGWKPFADLYHIYSIDMERFAVKKI